ncbi:MAG TPA: glycosyltransferase [Gemmatimonadales bacterium]|nr:glycosyltransferase [Gemmatimonadales bacterium]
MTLAQLTVLSVAFPFAPVGADAVGGAEQVLTALDAALVRRGHQSLVVACEGSSPAGTLISMPRLDPTEERAWADAHARCRAGIDSALARWPVDLVHMHGVDFHRYLPPPGRPVLATLHLPPAWYPASIFTPDRPRTWLNCVSATQRRACPFSPLAIPVIENGVPEPPFTQPPRRRGFALALGRICPEKGFHLALDAARRAGVALLLAGDVFDFPAHRRYFEQMIVPRLDRLRRFIGPVGLRRKQRLLAGASCLVVSSLVPETSSLVAMEALACGTPVVALAAGALGEIVTHGTTGMLVGNVSELADALRAAPALAGEACRAAGRRFSAERMAGDYLRMYRTIVADPDRLAPAALAPPANAA